MKRLLYIIALFFMWIPVFLVQKPGFMLYHLELGEGVTTLEWFEVMWHGLKLDLTVAGYLTVFPLLATLLSVWLPGPWLRKILKGYYLLMTLIVAVVFAGDMGLYGFWGFRLDSTVLFYMQSSFKDAMASVPVNESLFLALIAVIYWAAIYWLFSKLILAWTPENWVKKPIGHTIGIVLLGGLMFIPIRGGLTTATANVGMVYFSQNQFLNHAAINPLFSFLYSIRSEQDFSAQFNFFPEEEKAKILSELIPADKTVSPERIELLRTERPNVLLILLESFSYNAIEVLGGEPGITPHLNQLANEGILFDRFFANSFRTDRALPAILSGYPAQPTTSILKYPIKTANLPSLARSLAKEGYLTEMLYGGDINFANMGSYFHSSGYQRIVSDKDFPLNTRLSKWGVNDENTFEWLLQSMEERHAADSPWFCTFLTLSSHVPFDVPYHKFDDPYLNSVAYTDSCLGHFIDQLRQTPEWDNLLVVMMADHGYRYMENVPEYDTRRNYIPMVWTGGAVREPMTVSTIANQNDFATTLLSQLRIPSDDFLFGKDIMNPAHPHWAFYTFNNGFAFIDNSGVTIYDNDGETVLDDQPAAGGNHRLRNGKALLQGLYDDLQAR